VKFDGRDVTSTRGLPRLVSQTPIGKTVDIEVVRKGERRVLRVTVARLIEDEDKDKDQDKSQKPAGDNVPSTGNLIGLGLAPIDDDLRKTHGLDAKTKGVVVTEVDPQSPAAKRGVKVGDVIVEAGQDAVSSVADVAAGIEKVRKSGRKAVLLRIESGKGEMRFLAVPIE
jgi:serine protease Do